MRRRWECALAFSLVERVETVRKFWRRLEANRCTRTACRGCWVALSVWQCWWSLQACTASYPLRPDFWSRLDLIAPGLHQRARLQ